MVGGDVYQNHKCQGEQVWEGKTSSVWGLLGFIGCILVEHQKGNRMPTSKIQKRDLDETRGSK